MELQIETDEIRNQICVLEDTEKYINADERRLNELSEKIIGAAFEVDDYSILPRGLDEN